ncbi:MAG: sensor histidine kinase [Senegalia sp. (in: firmicutes)]
MKKLCKEHTKLSDSDIEKIEDIANALPLISDLVRSDIFIDCITHDPDVAIVVAESKPSTHESMYEYSVVGELAFRKNEPAALRTLETGMPTRDLKALTQENKNVRQNVVPIHNNKREVIGVLIMEKDITRDISAINKVEVLTETTEQLTETLLNIKDGRHALTYHVNDAIIIFNKKGIATYANPVAIELYQKLGYKDDIRGMEFNNLSLDENSIIEVINEPNLISSEVNVGKLVLQVKYALLQSENKIIGITMLIKDITEVREKEKELILKSVAMREIHHRVKNNLQTIASLLSLQSRRVDDKSTKKAFTDSINRMLSIAVTHEILAQSGIDEIDLKTIIEKIKNSTLKFGVPFMKKVSVSVSGDAITISSDKATSIALVVNELLQNSLSHAFKNKNEGYIRISVQKGILYSSVSIIDNGSGFDIDKIKKESLGLDIVKSIVEDKLQGHLNMDSTSSGTKVFFDFKNE